MINKILSFNRIVLILVIVEFFINGAFATVAPFFAVFINQGQITGGSVTVTGIAIAIYWITKSIFQLPIARWLDKTKGESDEFWALFTGYFFAAFVPLAYLLASLPWHIYVIQMFWGLVMAISVPAFYSIFTKHVDRREVGFEWSLFSVSVGVSSAIAAGLGGIIVDKFGFSTLFIVASVIMFFNTFLILFIKNQLLRKRTLNKAGVELLTKHQTKHNRRSYHLR